jgi:predicted transcriptional regulator
MLNLQSTVTELMRAPIITVHEQSQVCDVLELTEKCGVHYIAVQRDGRLLGRACACELWESRPADVMASFTRRLLATFSHDTSLAEAAAVLSPGMDWTFVVDGAGVIGLVTLNELRQALAGGLDSGREYRCAACGADHNLQLSRNEDLLCPDCCDGCQFVDWYDLGVAG